MDKNNYFHLLHYLILTVILFLAVILFFIFSGNRQYQFYTAIITSIIYLIWGIVHHYLEGDLHPKIVVEYLLIALLALILLRGAIYR